MVMIEIEVGSVLIGGHVGRELVKQLIGRGGGGGRGGAVQTTNQPTNQPGSAASGANNKQTLDRFGRRRRFPSKNLFARFLGFVASSSAVGHAPRMLAQIFLIGLCALFGYFVSALPCAPAANLTSIS